MARQWESIPQQMQAMDEEGQTALRVIHYFNNEVCTVESIVLPCVLIYRPKQDIGEKTGRWM